MQGMTQLIQLLGLLAEVSALCGLVTRDDKYICLVFDNSAADGL